MHPKRPKFGRPSWGAIFVASLWLLCSAIGAAAQGTPRVHKTAAVETYQGTPVGITADGHPFRGKPDAALTLVEYTDKGEPSARLVVVEFADFECPSCRRHALETQPALDERFVDTGGIMWVAKHFPLRIHPRAPVAAAAAVCAGDQGKFWEMHQVLFERAEQWSSGSDPDAALIQIAAEIKLDGAQFATCLASRRPLEHVLRHLYDGQSIGVRNSPTFILLRGETATAVVGARSTEQFESVLKQMLDKAESVTKAEVIGGRAPVTR